MESNNYVLIGGTKRALEAFRFIIKNKNIKVDYFIAMRGYEDEHIFADQIYQLATENKVDCIITDHIDDIIIRKTRRISPICILSVGIWRTKIPLEFLEISKNGMIGLHGSQLPKYRGWAGLSWYIINNEKNYIMRMFRVNSNYDSGDLVADSNNNLLEKIIDINNEKHLSEILDEVYHEHVNAINELINLIEKKEITFLPQNEEEASYTCHRGPDDGEINWNDTTKNIFNFIRAQSKPYPGAFTYFKGKKIRIWRARPRYDLDNYIGRIEGKVIERNLEKKTISILTKDSGIEILEAENNEGETNLLKLFSSVRDRCKSKVEAYMDFIGFE